MKNTLVLLGNELMDKSFMGGGRNVKPRFGHKCIVVSWQIRGRTFRHRDQTLAHFWNNDNAIWLQTKKRKLFLSPLFVIFALASSALLATDSRTLTRMGKRALEY